MSPPLSASASLTGVDQAGHEIGQNAARLLLERIADRDKPTSQARLTPTLVPRRTTAPVPKQRQSTGPPGGGVQPIG
ncbi:substrate-binding domain-containing protein [Streptomyces sp. NPDC060053]|uniref:substrate-binding domain-containing protein n=1 Tax=Streptomyces sp. NPDC060053 TaxID=3347047 RepID=UPI00368A1DE2